MNKASLTRISILLAVLPNFALAANTAYIHEYTDTVSEDKSPKLPEGYLSYKEQLKKSFQIEGSITEAYKKASAKVEVPGYISTVPAPLVGLIVGPNNSDNFYFRKGDTLYIRWKGVNQPRVGESYSVCTPMLVFQNIENPTDFAVHSETEPGGEEARGTPANYRLAGYLYEAKGKVKITRISQGLVTAMVDTQTSTIHVNDRLMTNLPVINQINPISGGIQLAAAIVSGSPFNRLASNERNFIYINRGARDGMKIGRMFEAVESVKLTTDSVANPEVSLGEAMIVYVSDSYSTAIITKQFEVIRIGALLKTKQELNAQLLPKKSFAARQEAPQNIQRETEVPDPNAGVKELPPQALQNQERIETAPLSELDQIEKSSKAKALSAGEKNTLDKLVTQEAKKKENAKMLLS